ncbi:DUF4190 domain-containing protein [Virgibacillus sp. SK37]|uniref:DUF4190 domain-containing protein n=1 Tax=Virgibacillus sp. SK37 TaxID=403957 RepID=UPI0004D1214E|nr:DUF4190 domain-containing protein [Virgibacillus sp. SK37]AIF42880.1 hypothetical protein X953_06395 [Virgibacillus sp. SK37]
MSSLEVSKRSMTNSKATASLILGVISIVLLIIPFAGLILAVVGLTLGIIGWREIKRLKQEGKKIAISGIVCSSLGILLPMISSIIASVALFN